jgi:predicted TIM-barrel fold metal-dependent hydrolase
MKRRTFIKSFVFMPLVAAALSKQNTQAAPRPAAKPRRFIDVHCHFFNAADLPVRGFLRQVVLADYAVSTGEQASAASTFAAGAWRGMVAKLADLVIRRQAPTPQQELNCFHQSGDCRGFSIGAAKLATKEDTKSLKPAAVDDGASLSQVLQDHYEGERAHTNKSAAQASTDADVDDFVDFVQQEMKASGTRIPGGSFQKGMPSAGDALRTIADFLTSGRSIFSRYFQWAGVLTDYRANIASTYRSLYDPTASRLILATPALVDYNFWLQDQSPAPIKDQIELMGLLSLRSPFPIHGFAPFDPLREVRRLPAETSSLDTVQDAVQRHGFLGAKLYSPMGFRPSGNEENGLPFPAAVSGTDKEFGRRLDQALDRLYAWCAAEDVPVLAHTTDSQSAGPDFATRAEPRFWQAVLDKYPNLRLNLAHFGNFSQAFVPKKGDAAARFDKTWEYEIGMLIKSGRYPNVYADISYFYWVLEGSEEKKKIKTVKVLLKRYLDMFDRDVDRLMFGTDWNMIGKATGFDGYVDNVEAFFRDIGLTNKQLDKLFATNAVRFLGLDSSDKVRDRLKGFYAAAGKPVPSFS